jgi:hypothetical protein
MSINDLCQRIDISIRIIEKKISKFREIGYMKRTGSTKSEHWDVLK